MKEFVAGVCKYASEVFPKQEGLFKELNDGQQPHTLFITCSDSRIDPNLITQTNPGELFVIRNAGNMIPPFGSSHGGEEAAVEYAVDALGVKNIVVCGHAKCGAMGALIQPESVAALPAVAKWLDHGESVRRRLGGEANLDKAIEQNILVQVENLKTHPSVSARYAEGKVKIFGAIYDFPNGKMRAYHPGKGQYVGLEEGVVGELAI